MRIEEDEGYVSPIELEDNLMDAEKPAVLKAGVYKGEILTVQEKTSAQGNAYFAIAFKIPPSEIHADQAEDFDDGVTLYYNRLLRPKGNDRRAKWNLKQFILAIGLDANTSTIDPQNDWIGREAKLKVKSSKWQGEDRAEIERIESAETAPAPKATSKAAARRR